MLLLFFFFCSVFSYLPEIQLPWPILPLGDSNFPSLRNKTFLVIGCSKVGLRVALQVHKLDATLVCTTNDINTFDRSSLPASVEVMELNFCKNESVLNFIDAYMQKYKLPNYIDDLGLSIYDDFTKEQIGCSPYTYIINNMLLEKELLRHNNDLSFRIKSNSALLSSTMSTLPIYHENFNLYKIYNILDDVRKYNTNRVMVRTGAIASSKACSADIALAHLQILLYVVYDGRPMFQVRVM